MHPGLCKPTISVTNAFRQKFLRNSVKSAQTKCSQSKYSYFLEAHVWNEPEKILWTMFWNHLAVFHCFLCLPVCLFSHTIYRHLSGHTRAFSQLLQTSMMDSKEEGSKDQPVLNPQPLFWPLSPRWILFGSVLDHKSSLVVSCFSGAWAVL